MSKVRDGKGMNQGFHLVIRMMSDPLSTLQTENVAISPTPAGSPLGNSWEYSYLLLRVQDQTGLQPYYSWKISAMPHDLGREGGMFMTAPRCNFAGRDSVGEMFVSYV